MDEPWRQALRTITWIAALLIVVALALYLLFGPGLQRDCSLHDYSCPVPGPNGEYPAVPCCHP